MEACVRGRAVFKVSKLAAISEKTKYTLICKPDKLLFEGKRTRNWNVSVCKRIFIWAACSAWWNSAQNMSFPSGNSWAQVIRGFTSATLSNGSSAWKRGHKGWRAGLNQSRATKQRCVPNGVEKLYRKKKFSHIHAPNVYTTSSIVLLQCMYSDQQKHNTEEKPLWSSRSEPGVIITVNIRIFDVPYSSLNKSPYQYSNTV